LSRNLQQTNLHEKSATTKQTNSNNISIQTQSKPATFTSMSPPSTFNFNSNNNKSSPNTNQQIKFSTSNIMTTPKTNNSINYNGKPSSAAKLNGSSSLACPSSTTEQSPAPSLVPIPFGLTTSDPFSTIHNSNLINKLDFNDDNTLNTQNTNKLFSSLFSNTKEETTTLNKPNPLSVLINASNQSGSPPPPPIGEDSQFQKLLKLNKLKEAIRSDTKISSFFNEKSSSNNTSILKDIIEYFKQLCVKNKVKLDYVQYVSISTKETEKYFVGELYLENFRLIKFKDTKRKRCSLIAHKKALYLLQCPNDLAVRIAPQYKRENNIKLDDNNNNNNNTELDFEYEIYSINSEENNNINNHNDFDDMLDIDYDDAEEDEINLNEQANHESNIFHLNTMLRSLLLPKTNLNESEIQGNDDDDNEEDENDDNNISVHRKNK
jgi:hypothetical protein